MTADEARQLEGFIAQNLEHAVMCAESARQVVTELGSGENLATLRDGVSHALHFIEQAQRHLEELQRRLEQGTEAEAAH